MLRILALLAWITLPALAAAQEQGWAAKMFNEKLSHDFGTIAPGSQLTHKFTFSNPYNVPFFVENVRTNCGCTEAKKPAKAVGPKESADLELIVDTRKLPITGQNKVVNIFVTLRSIPPARQRPFSSSCNLTISFLLKADLRYSQDRIAFGEVAAGTEKKASVTIEHMNDEKWEISGAAEHKFPLTVAVTKAQPGTGAKAAFKVEATLKPDAPAGDQNYELKLKTNDKETPLVTLVVNASVKSALSATPSSVNFGVIRVGEKGQSRVILRGPAGQSFKVVKVEGDDGLVIRIADKAAANPIVGIEFAATKAGKLSQTVTFITDLPGDLKVSVPVEAMVNP